MASIVTTATTNLNNPLIKIALTEGLQYEGESFASNYYKREAIDQPALIDTSVSTPHYLRRIEEDQVVPAVGIVQGYESVIPWAAYGISRQITKQAQLLKGGDTLMDMVKDHAEDLLRTRDAHATKLFRQGFDSSVLLADGQRFFTTAHPLRNGGTNANTFSDANQRPFSYDTYSSALTVMNRQTDNSGNPIMGSSKKVIMIGDNNALLEKVFQVVGGSKNSMKAGTNNNDKNFFTQYEGVGADIMVLPTLSLLTARAIGETTNTQTTNGAQWDNRWYIMDANRAKKVLAESALKGHENLVQSLMTESFSDKFIFETTWGFGVRAGDVTPFFGSRGDGLTL